jgi:hypothetical protein
MAPLCREFGISRVAGYKIFERCKTCGLDGLYDRSRRPSSNAPVHAAVRPQLPLSNSIPLQSETGLLNPLPRFGYG